MKHSRLSECLTEYYETLAALTYISSADIIYPPSNGHTNIDTEAANEQGFNADMIFLMRHLPYLSVDCEDTPIFPHGTKVRSYLDVDYMDWARDPIFQGKHTTKATHLVLSNPAKAGIILIYDTVNETLIPWSPTRDDVLSTRLGRERESSPGMPYQHLPAFSPERLLGMWTKKLISLTTMPYRDSTGWPCLVEEPTTAELQSASNHAHLQQQIQLNLVRRTLKDVYAASGWSTKAQCLEDAKRDFDPAVFKGKCREWRVTTQALLDEAYQKQWTWSAMRERLNLPEDEALLQDCKASEGGSDRPCVHLKI